MKNFERRIIKKDREKTLSFDLHYLGVDKNITKSICLKN